MSVCDVSDDECPNCRIRFEILLIKFKLAGVRMISACPNCAMIHGDSSNRAVVVRKFLEARTLSIPPPLQVRDGGEAATLADVEPVLAFVSAGSLTMPNDPSKKDRDFDAEATEALEAARLMPPASEKIEALKKAGLLRKTADAHGLSFAKRGRPPK